MLEGVYSFSKGGVGRSSGDEDRDGDSGDHDHGGGDGDEMVYA